MRNTSKYRVWSPKRRLVRNIPETFKGLDILQLRVSMAAQIPLLFIIRLDTVFAILLYKILKDSPLRESLRIFKLLSFIYILIENIKKLCLFS